MTQKVQDILIASSAKANKDSKSGSSYLEYFEELGKQV
jgi:hypothetical protein